MAHGGFLPRHDEDLREPLVRRQGSQVSMRVVLILMWGLVLQPRIETQPLALGTLRLSLWTSREAHRFFLKVGLSRNKWG